MSCISKAFDLDILKKSRYIRKINSYGDFNFMFVFAVYISFFCWETFGIVTFFWFLIGVLLASIILLAWFKWRRKPSKGRFALTALTAIVSCFFTGIAVNNTGIINIFLSNILKYFGYTPIDNGSPYPNVFLTCMVMLFIYLFASHTIKNWEAPETVSEIKLSELMLDKNFWALINNQILLIFKNQSDPIAHDYVVNWKNQIPDLPRPFERKDLLRDLLSACKREITFADNGWRDEGRYWIGERHGVYEEETTKVIVFIFDEIPSLAALENRIEETSVALSGTSNLKFYALYLSETDIEEKSGLFDVNNVKIEVLSSRQMVFKGLDLTGYARDLLRNFKTTRVGGTTATLEKTFVELNVKSRSNIKSLSDALHEWSRDNTNMHIAITGEYGQGKSTALLKYCCEWAERFVSDNEIREKVPLLIELRGKNPAETDPLGFLSTWCSRYGLLPKQVLNLIKSGDAIVIFEGFDELKNSGRAFDRHQHFNALWRFAYPGTKLIFTGRPNFFLDQAEANRTLRSDSIRNAAGSAYTEVWSLLRFNRQQIEDACRSYEKNIANGLVNSINVNDGFFDIVTRPSMLPVVATIWNEIEELQREGIPLTGAVLMESYIRAIFARKETELERDHIELDSPKGSRYLLLPKAVRELLTICVAWRMSGLRAQNTIPRSEISLMVKDCYAVLMSFGKSEGVVSEISSGLHDFEQRHVDQNLAEIIEIITTEVCSAGLLIPDAAGGSTNLRFPHKQFFEFLVARGICITGSVRTPTCANIIKKSSAENSVFIRLKNERNSVDYLAECIGPNLNLLFGRIDRALLLALTVLSLISNLTLNKIWKYISKIPPKKDKKTKKDNDKDNLYNDSVDDYHSYIVQLSFTSIQLVFGLVFSGFGLFLIHISHNFNVKINIFEIILSSLFVCIASSFYIILTPVSIASRYVLLMQFLYVHWRKADQLPRSLQESLSLTIRSLWSGKVEFSLSRPTVRYNYEQFLYPALDFEKHK